jgi:hypothetical protein
MLAMRVIMTAAMPVLTAEATMCPSCAFPIRNEASVLLLGSISEENISARESVVKAEGADIAGPGNINVGLKLKKTYSGEAKFVNERRSISIVIFYVSNFTKSSPAQKNNNNRPATTTSSPPPTISIVLWKSGPGRMGQSTKAF